MSYNLIKSSHFSKKAAKLLKFNPNMRTFLIETLQVLNIDPFAPKLKTHRLKGQLFGSYACSINYEYRIVFKIFNEFELADNTEKVIFLETIGTHDEVY